VPSLVFELPLALVGLMSQTVVIVKRYAWLHLVASGGHLKAAGSWCWLVLATLQPCRPCLWTLAWPPSTTGCATCVPRQPRPEAEKQEYIDHIQVG